MPAWEEGSPLKAYCILPAKLIRQLPKDQLQNMQKAINNPGGLCKPGQGNIPAAAVNGLPSGAGEHAEWRWLQGSWKSPVRKLLAWTYNTSCLIFFTLDSPCAGRCLRKNRPHSIVDMVSDTFRPLGSNSKAFVFRQIDQEAVTPQSLLEAWHQLHYVPLLH
ncbi:unnamed protein product [Lepidochelys olivacea]